MGSFELPLPEAHPGGGFPPTPDGTGLTDRELAIVRLTARFKQLTTNHLFALLPHHFTSRTPINRAVKRLVERKYLHKVERRIVGGAHGGSGQYVYSLGRKGFYLHFEGRYVPARTVAPHTLAITDLYVALVGLQDAGAVSVVGLSTEPDCWAVFGRYELHPDLYTELQLPDGRLKLWWEVDMGTEGQRQLRAKLDAVWRAYNDAEADAWPVFPRTVWCVIDAEREKELRWLIEQMPADARDLFRVCRLATMRGVLGLSYPQE